MDSSQRTLEHYKRTLEHYSSAHYREGHLVASIFFCFPLFFALSLCALRIYYYFCGIKVEQKYFLRIIQYPNSFYISRSHHQNNLAHRPIALLIHCLGADSNISYLCKYHVIMNYELLLTAVGLGVTILSAMWAGFAWLNNQIKDVRNELKGDIKRVEDKLDVKERELRVDFKTDNDKSTSEMIELKLKLQRLSLKDEEREKTTRGLQESYANLVASLKRALPELNI